MLQMIGRFIMPLRDFLCTSIYKEKCPLAYFFAAFLFRGIDVVRNKIKMFAQKKVTLPPGRHKVVILDEADR